ncbi:protein kinase kinase kinase [Seminavis robusta]|uniref:Protein kinase kinase kinase n=1 Tax=Seminavis robusta TaxID=568900 RepID=A0A9N8DJP6_9STRA|nr:protein kinase kinase kinase [Seminavis robusta]|eukprot:Sro123_g059530.1 protein kinase kinase kinase (290) ;mRNA; r:45131-46584
MMMRNYQLLSFLLSWALVACFPVVEGQNYSAFRTSGELRVAVESWIADDTEQVIATYGPIDVWDVSLVDDFKGLFQGHASFNDNITSWDTRSATDMDRMFFGATSFNQDLSNWNTTKVTSMVSTFQAATAFAGDISTWQTGQVKSMADMFRGASSFNTDISFWDVTSVRDMSTMFWEALAFNMDISNWDVSRNKEFTGTFRNATAFGQKLCWVFREEAIVTGMFCGTKDASICEDKICNHDLYHDDKCVRPSVLALTGCDAPLASAAWKPRPLVLMAVTTIMAALAMAL